MCSAPVDRVGCVLLDSSQELWVGIPTWRSLSVARVYLSQYNFINLVGGLLTLMSI